MPDVNGPLNSFEPYCNRLAFCPFGIGLLRATATAESCPRARPPLPRRKVCFSRAPSPRLRQKSRSNSHLNPSSVEGYNLLGIVYTNEKEFDQAVDAFQHALKLNPSSAKTHNNLGNVYVSEEKFDLAEKEFRKSVTLDPANRDGHYNLGLVLMAKGSPAEAIPQFLQVRPLNMATRFNLVRAYFLAGRTKEGLAAAAQLSAQEQKTSNCTSLSASCWPQRNNTNRLNVNWKKPTRCSRKLSKSSTTWARLTYAVANTKKPK